MKTLADNLVSKEFLFRFVSVLFIIASLNYTQYSLNLLVLSGITLGIYYGLYNDIIWRPTGALSESVTYRAHQLWIHLICGIVGSISLYILSGSIDLVSASYSITRLGATEFVLFGISLLAYVGLLPRILWFLSYAQNIKSPKK